MPRSLPRGSKAARGRTYKQLALPYDPADLRQPLRPVPPPMAVPPALPPGLREMATAEGLTNSQVRQLLDAASTIRGKYPATVDEWRTFCAAIKAFVWGGAH